MKIILILCDALRYDRVNEQVMPNLTELSKLGTTFKMFFGDGGTTKWSLPYFLSGEREFHIKKSFPFHLTENGIYNLIVHSNVVLAIDRFQFCFHSFIDMGMKEAPVETTIRRSLRKTNIWKKTRKIRMKLFNQHFNIPYRRSENTFEVIQKHIDENDDFFIWSHLMDCHIPYSPPKLFADEQNKAIELYYRLLHKKEFSLEENLFLQSLYDKECNYMDEQISKFILNNMNCNFIITSDHGEMFGENDSYSHGPWFHGMTLQLGHLPFIAIGPDFKNKVVDRYYHSIDLGSTILKMFGIDHQIGYGKPIRELIK